MKYLILITVLHVCSLTGCNAYQPVQASMLPDKVRDEVRAQYPDGSIEHVEMKLVGETYHTVYYYRWRGMVIKGTQVLSHFKAGPEGMQFKPAKEELGSAD